MFLLVGCIESVAVLGGGASNGKIVQSSLRSVASYGVKQTTGKTVFGHAIDYVKTNNTLKKKSSCSSFVNKKDLEICLMVEKRIISKQAKIEEKESLNKHSIEGISSLQSSINEKFKIKYLD
jgi:hypothetical protein